MSINTNIGQTIASHTLTIQFRIIVLNLNKHISIVTKCTNWEFWSQIRFAIWNNICTIICQTGSSTCSSNAYIYIDTILIIPNLVVTTLKVSSPRGSVCKVRYTGVLLTLFKQFMCGNELLKPYYIRCGHSREHLELHFLCLIFSILPDCCPLCLLSHSHFALELQLVGLANSQKGLHQHRNLIMMLGMWYWTSEHR